jgi:hypothetical protein
MPNSVPPSFDGFAIIGSLAIMTQFSFRPMALRHPLSRDFAHLDLPTCSPSGAYLSSPGCVFYLPDLKRGKSEFFFRRTFFLIARRAENRKRGVAKSPAPQSKTSPRFSDEKNKRKKNGYPPDLPRGASVGPNPCPHEIENIGFSDIHVPTPFFSNGGGFFCFVLSSTGRTTTTLEHCHYFFHGAASNFRCPQLLTHQMSASCHDPIRSNNTPAICPHCSSRTMKEIPACRLTHLGEGEAAGVRRSAHF